MPLFHLLVFDVPKHVRLDHGASKEIPVFVSVYERERRGREGVWATVEPVELAESDGDFQFKLPDGKRRVVVGRNVQEDSRQVCATRWGMEDVWVQTEAQDRIRMLGCVSEALELATELEKVKLRLQQSEARCDDLSAKVEELEQETCKVKVNLEISKTEVGKSWVNASALERALGWGTASSLPHFAYHTGEYSRQALQPENPVFKLFAHQTRSTAKQHAANQRSSIICPAPELIVKGVDLITNSELCSEYARSAEGFLALNLRIRKSGCTPIPCLEHLKLESGMGLGAGPDINEYFLFFGACNDGIDNICKYGFGREAAVCLAANSSRADINTDTLGKRFPQQAERQLVVARVLLGEACVVNGRQPIPKRAPEGRDGRPSDSVWAEMPEGEGAATTSIEAMVYDRFQAYPTAVVTYSHLGTCSCAECMKRPPT